MAPLCGLARYVASVSMLRICLYRIKQYRPIISSYHRVAARLNSSRRRCGVRAGRSGALHVKLSSHRDRGNDAP